MWLSLLTVSWFVVTTVLATGRSGSSLRLTAGPDEESTVDENTPGRWLEMDDSDSKTLNKGLSAKVAAWNYTSTSDRMSRKVKHVLDTMSLNETLLLADGTYITPIEGTRDHAGRDLAVGCGANFYGRCDQDAGDYRWNAFETLFDVANSRQYTDGWSTTVSVGYRTADYGDVIKNEIKCELTLIARQKQPTSCASGAGCKRVKYCLTSLRCKGTMSYYCRQTFGT